MGEVMAKIKPQKPETFIGWTSDDGLLEVIGINKDYKKGRTLFNVICHKCKEDRELFPQDYFICDKSFLKNDGKPCGCSKKPEWSEEQWLIRAKREGLTRNVIVHGFAEEFHGQTTKIHCECTIHNHHWTPNLSNFINHKKGCTKCSNTYKPTEQEALDKCKTICEAEGYEPIGFLDGYSNQRSVFKYKCPIHGNQSIRYHNFIYGKRCPACWNERRKTISNLYGWYPERKDERDFLYVLDFNKEYIKVGRAFNVKDRINKLRYESGVNDIKLISIYTSDNESIFNLEQAIHIKLTDLGFYHEESKWSTETFHNNCLSILIDFLSTSGYKKIK